MSPSQWSGPKLNRVSNAMAVLALVLAVGVGVYFWKANAEQDRVQAAQTARIASVELGGQNLAMQLDRQRAQFEACKDAKAGTPGCNTVATPAAKDVAPQIVTGPPGPQGYQGRQGDTGLTGLNGAAGKAGTDGIATNGTNGLNGVDGADGQDGADGATGAAGANGVDGQPPYSWTTTDKAGVAFTCTRDDPFDPTKPAYHCEPTGATTP